MKEERSILSDDMGNTEPGLDILNSSEADYIHHDEMDGVFVPNISFGFDVRNAEHKRGEKPLDVQLMIVEPDKGKQQVRDLGAEIMNVHQEDYTPLHSRVGTNRTQG